MFANKELSFHKSANNSIVLKIYVSHVLLDIIYLKIKKSVHNSHLESEDANNIKTNKLVIFAKKINISQIILV